MIKLMGNARNPEGPKQSLKKRTRLEDTCFPISKLTTATVIKTMWYWHKDRYIDQWNRDVNVHLWLTKFS